MKAKLAVLGVRGSIPVADRQFMEYGGNTSCMVLEYGDEALCFDAGSGLCGLRNRLSGVQRLHILISHVHIDHILGLVNLTLLKVPEIHLYGAGSGGCSFQKQLETVIGMPYWPVALSDTGSVHIHEIHPKEPFLLSGAGGGMKIQMLRGNHPGGSLLYRAEFDGDSITYALDCEMNEGMHSRLAAFAAGSSLLIWDANFVRADKQPGWGHSTWEEGLALRRASGAERILMTHYAREYTDAFLRGQELLAQREDNACIFAREGMVIEI